MGAAMIKAIRFKNFKALRDTTLPLGPLTILVGPNGSGKSTALQGLHLRDPDIVNALSVGVEYGTVNQIRVEIVWDHPTHAEVSWICGSGRGGTKRGHTDHDGDNVAGGELDDILAAARVYSLDATMLANPVELVPNIELGPQGQGLPAVLDRLRDNWPERFQALNEEFGRCLPEFDQILFDTPRKGFRGLKLRIRDGQHLIPAEHVSQGSLLALAVLTLAYLPDPPPILGLEEPGRGIHPRLLRDIKDAMYRLAYPESFGEKRDPVQVVATTHSPYMLDLFRDHPEEIVIASKVEGNVEFKRLSDLRNIDEILSSAPLGEVWYSGILGGVPT